MNDKSLPPPRFYEILLSSTNQPNSGFAWSPTQQATADSQSESAGTHSQTPQAYSVHEFHDATESPFAMRSRQATHIIYPEFCSSNDSSEGSTSNRNGVRETSEKQVTGALSKLTRSRFGTSIFRKDSGGSQRRFRGKCRAFIMEHVMGTKSEEDWLSGVEQCEVTESSTEDGFTLVDVDEKVISGETGEPSIDGGDDDLDRIELEATDLEPRLGFSLEIADGDVKRGKQIGAGAFGRVFIAQYKDRVVVKKEIAPHNYSNPLGNGRFIKALSAELRLLGHIGRHPNVLECYGGSIAEPNMFMLCQLMDRSLADLLYNGPDGTSALQPDLALQITRDILAGLDHLHNWKPRVVHRDIKPENILLNAQNHACVADFGLSRIKSHTYINTENAHAGTSEYLAPEVSTGKINEKMDIYSVGVVLWECLMGQRPWDGYHPIAVFLNVSRGQRLDLPDAIFPEEHPYGESDNHDGRCVKNGQCGVGVVDLRVVIRRVIERCWIASPSERPSCRELLDYIDDFVLKWQQQGQ